ncbi:hypothetical protein ES703_93005 [subsurface metagenome]
MLIYHCHRLDHIPFSLAHLLPFSIKDVPQTDNILETGTAKQQGRYSMQTVKPATGLVNSFTNIIGREPPIPKQGIILKWVVPLGYGHGSGIKPAVNYL